MSVISDGFILVAPPSAWVDVFAKVRGTSLQKQCYLSYLRSSAWKAKRHAAMEAAGYKCWRCIGGMATEVHHLTYDRLGDEAPDDLEPLCSDCHKAAHEVAHA